eukprot:4505993-Prymnesium_polylepis.1
MALKNASYSAAELIKAGFNDAVQLAKAGYAYDELLQLEENDPSCAKGLYMPIAHVTKEMATQHIIMCVAHSDFRSHLSVEVIRAAEITIDTKLTANASNWNFNGFSFLRAQVGLFGVMAAPLLPLAAVAAPIDAA